MPPSSLRHRHSAVITPPSLLRHRVAATSCRAVAHMICDEPSQDSHNSTTRRRNAVASPRHLVTNYAAANLQHAVANLQHSQNCNIPSQICNMPSQICNMQSQSTSGHPCRRQFASSMPIFFRRRPAPACPGPACSAPTPVAEPAPTRRPPERASSPGRRLLFRRARAPAPATPPPRCRAAPRACSSRKHCRAASPAPSRKRRAASPASSRKRRAASPATPAASGKRPRDPLVENSGGCAESREEHERRHPVKIHAICENHGS